MSCVGLDGPPAKRPMPALLSAPPMRGGFRGRGGGPNGVGMRGRGRGMTPSFAAGRGQCTTYFCCDDHRSFHSAVHSQNELNWIFLLFENARLLPSTIYSTVETLIIIMLCIFTRCA